VATEQRLVDIRDEAQRHGVVAGSGVRPAGSPFPQPSPEAGYYGLPLLKPPTWTWEVPAYFFVGGAAGASAMIAMVAPTRLARHARLVAAIGGIVSGGLLTSDLGRPARFLYMLRVFKRQSPMSVGAWTLTAFSGAAMATVAADVWASHTDAVLPRVARAAAGTAAAGTGLVMATYTGVLIGATAIPAWNRHVRVLPIHFAASGLASAVAILELIGHRDRALRHLGIAAAAVETGAGAALELSRGEASRPLKRGTSGWITRAGGLLSGPVPMWLRARTDTPSPAMRRVAAAITLTGALLTRIGWWKAGTASANDPKVPLQLV
jgi:hypothetical protein